MNLNNTNLTNTNTNATNTSSSSNSSSIMNKSTKINLNSSQTNSILNSNNSQLNSLSTQSTILPTSVSAAAAGSTNSSALTSTPTTTTTTPQTNTSTSTQATSNSSNFGGFAYCAKCGEYGVKAAFYGKSKLYCSVACQNKTQQSLKRTYDAANTNTTNGSNSLNNNQPQPSNNPSVINTPTATTTTTTSISTSIPLTTPPIITHQSSINLPPTTPTATIVHPPTFISSNSQSSSSSSSSSSSTSTSISTSLIPPPDIILSQPPAQKIQKITHQPTTTNNTTSHHPQQQQQQQHHNNSHNTNTLTTNNSSTSSTKFSWSQYIEKENANAAPVYAFKHVPLSQFWPKIMNDIKVEVPNRDYCESDKLPNYWFASVIKYAGYLAKLRFIGYEDNDKNDFWMHLCDPTVHPVGWSAENDVPLIPPKDIVDKVDDWKEYLITKLTGFKTLPKNFHRKVKESLNSKFKKGMYIELIDKKKLSRMKVSRIIDNIGGRLRMKYENSEDFDDFWCHQESELIHPIGWSMLIGHDIDADDNYKKSSLAKITKNQFDSNECSPDMFKKMRELNSLQSVKHFKESMKLEAIDPLNLSAICVATIAKVLKNNYLMIRIDGCKQEDGSDMFCYSRTSSSIFPAGFCQQNKIPLQKPYDYNGEFNWEAYLRETNAQFAPAELFCSDDALQNPFKVGMKLESVDLMEPKMICVATVDKVVNRLIRLNFDGWDHEYDQWVDCESCDIYPVGWCQLVNYPLEPPRKSEYENTQNMKKKSKKIKRNSKSK